jgi:opacity protein-like surface antigen
MHARHILAAAAMATTLAVSAGSSMAQHANFVLFGDPNPEAARQEAQEKFVHPITSPYYHEDSFVTSDVRAWYLFHGFDDAPLGGGDAQVYALQVRLALTDQLQLVAYKDGYLQFDTDALEEDGWNDVAAGLKWNFIQDWNNNFHAAVGAGYEFPFGDAKVLQNDDDVRVWASVNKGFDMVHLGATVNLFAPLSNDDSWRFYWNLHADYYLCSWASLVAEVNGYHTLDGADAGEPGFSGLDVADIGGGPDVVTAALGAEFRVMENLALRGAYEFAVTEDDADLFGWRVTLSAIYSL